MHLDKDAHACDTGIGLERYEVNSMGILITFILGIFLLLGVVVVRLAKGSRMIEQFSISIALGTMCSLVVLELIPDVLETFTAMRLIPAGIAVIIGIAVLKVLDHFIPDHEQGHNESEQTQENVIHIGMISAVAIVLHNIVEGMAVYSLTAESLKVGILMAFGVGLHNIPMGMLVYSTLQKESRRKQVLVLGAAAGSTFLGGVLMALISPVLNEFVIGILICLALGMLLYIIIFELIPHLIHSSHKGLSVLGTGIGIAIIILSSLLE